MPIRSNTFSKGILLPLFFLAIGTILASYSILSPKYTHPNLQAGAFVDRLPVPFSTVQVGAVEIPIQVDHFLVFQNYQVTPYPFTATENYLFGIFIFLLFVWF